MLSNKVVSEHNVEKVKLLAGELREELSRHVEALRLRVSEYAVIPERREIRTASQEPTLRQDESPPVSIPPPSPTSPVAATTNFKSGETPPVMKAN
jgi:hypothetical protein